MKRQEAASSLQSPARGRTRSPSTICSLSPNTFLVLREKARVRGGKTAPTATILLCAENHLENKETRDWRNRIPASHVGFRCVKFATQPNNQLRTKQHILKGDNHG